MSEIRHWLALEGPVYGVPRVVKSEEAAERYRQADGWTVEGPFVLADAYREAVEALREARAFLDTRHGSDGKLRRPAALIERIDGIVGEPGPGEET